MEQFGLNEAKARALKDEAVREINSPVGLTIGYFDLESTKLIGDIGRCLVGTILSYPSMEMKTFRIDDPEMGARNAADDRSLVTAIRDRLETHHMLIGWYSKGFDIPFLNTRLVDNGERPIARHLHCDPIYYYRGWRGLKPRSSKLATVAQFYELDERKLEVDNSIWADAAGGDSDALDIIVERCESDVRLLAAIAKKTFDLGLVKNIQMYP